MQVEGLLLHINDTLDIVPQWGTVLHCGFPHDIQSSALLHLRCLCQQSQASGVAGPLALVLLALDTLEQSYSNLSIFGALRRSTCLHFEVDRHLWVFSIAYLSLLSQPLMA
jgi:hypothetical protein